MKRADTTKLLYCLAAGAWIFLYLLANNKTDWDLWGVMSFGALLDQNPGVFPYRDPFSYTAYALPWIYHEWGSGMVFYQVFKHLGSPGLFWLKTLLVGGTFGLVCLPFSRKPEHEGPGRFLFYLSLLVSVYLVMPICATTIRCQYFTFLLFALFLLVLESARHESRPARARLRPWLLPPLMLLWVNLHGGFIAGLFLLAVYFLEAFFQKRPTAGALGVAALLGGIMVAVNPYGFSFITAITAAWALPRSAISEWGNVFTLDIPFYGGMYSAMLVFWLTAAFLRWVRRPCEFPLELILLGFTGVNGWLHYKLTPLFLISVLAVGINTVPDSWVVRMRPGWLRPIAAYILPLLIALMGLIPAGMFIASQANPFHARVQGLDTVQKGRAITRFAYPLGATAFLRANHLRGNLWAPFAWGEFLYWELYPDFRVSIDGRYETIYPQRVYDATQRFYRPPYDLAAPLAYPTTHVLVPQSERKLAALMLKDAHWKLLYRDHMSLLFETAGHSTPLSSSTAKTSSFPETSGLLDDYLGNPSRFRFEQD